MPLLRPLVLCLLLLFAWSREARADLDLSIGFSDAEFTAYFRQAILSRTLPGHDDHAGRLARWEGPVRLIAFDTTDETDEAAAPLFDQIDVVANQIHDTTGLDIDVQRVSSTQALLRALRADRRPNLLVSLGIIPFTDQIDDGTKRQLDLLFKHQKLIAPCQADQCGSELVIGFKAKETISFGFLAIDPGDPAYGRAAIAEGLLRIVSDAAAVDAAYPSVLGWHRDVPFDRRGLSRMDRLMLHILYDPRLTPGMGSPEVDALLPVLLADAKVAVPH